MAGLFLLIGGLALAFTGLVLYFRRKQEPLLMLVAVGGILAFISVPWLEQLDRTSWPSPVIWLWHHAWLVITVLVSAWAIIQFLRNMGTLAWPSVMGKVTRSEVVFRGLYTEKERRGRSRYAWNVSYTYAVNGHSYASDRKAMDSDEDVGHMAAQNSADAHPVGSEIRVFHHPKDPSIACIERGLVNGRWLVPGVVALLLIIGLFVRE